MPWGQPHPWMHSDRLRRAMRALDDPPCKRASWKLQMQRRRAKWKASGRCTSCGAARDGIWKSCALCRVSLRIRWERQAYRRRHALGI